MMRNVRMTRWVSVTIVLLSVFSISHRAISQAPTAYASAHSTADTGRMAWGHQSFASYDTPSECDRGVAAVLFSRMRMRGADTIAYTLAGDTLTTAARLAAHACKAPFTAEGIPAFALWSMIRLALSDDDVPTAERAFNRIVPLPGDPMTTIRRYSNAVNTYLTASPPRPEAARRILRQISALPPSIGARMAAYESRILFIKYWQRVYEVDSIQAEANAAIAIAKTFTPRELDAVDAITPFFALFEVANDRNDLAAQEAILTRADTSVGPWRNGWGAGQILGLRKLLQLRQSSYGKQPRTLVASHMFNQRNTPHPAAGKASLIVFVQPGCREECYQLFTILRTLATHYGDSLDVTILSETLGYLPDIGLVSPDSETSAMANYYRTFWRMPVNVLIEARTITHSPDGRINYRPSKLGTMFNYWQFLNTVLVDREGHVRWLGSVLSFAQQRQLEAIVRSTVQ